MLTPDQDSIVDASNLSEAARPAHSQSTVFADSDFALRYELRECLQMMGHRGYYMSARILCALSDTPPDARILDLGCGTALSTLAIMETHPLATTLGLDRGRGMVTLAQYKFFPSDGSVTDELHGKIDSQVSAQEAGRLKQHLEQMRSRASRFAGQVKFVVAEAKDCSELIEGQVDAAFGNQVFHWFRGEGLDYEAQTLEALHRCIRPGGNFVFNTTSADCEFSNSAYARLELDHHPFYVAFREHAFDEMVSRGIAQRRPSPPSRPLFSRGEIQGIMEDHGFRIILTREAVMVRAPGDILDICRLSSDMAIFEKTGHRDVPAVVRREILDAAYQKACKDAALVGSIEAVPCCQALAYFVAQRLP